MSLWFIKGRSQARVSPFKGTSTQAIYRHLLKTDFCKEKKIADSCAPEYSYRANQKDESIQATNKAMFA